ncbi:hypothetical protein [Oceanobacillus sp. CFH 90083]|uniref:hypothetical protein n=1 Tax=Oceanobacillus sp. CFH 90083 TaxID=2592336 RepID=UPI00128D44F7|nr:hypothetical protein [Oceanobacillus sp. CFH 90083]
MKRYLTLILFVLSILIIYIGAKLQLYWSGVVAWGLALVCLIFAVYYSKYIPNEKASKKKKGI